MSIHLGLLVFPNVQQLDLTGPYEVFASVPDATTDLVWKDREELTSSTGLLLRPTATLRECPVFDVLCVPGGAGVNALLEDEEVLSFLRFEAARARYLTSVCTGSLLLGAAGLLEGRRATTHWYSHDFLAAFGALPVRSRVVRDGKLITGGGVTSGVDLALTVVAALLGRRQAEIIQLALEYAPKPPFRAGTPLEASSEVRAAAEARLQSIRAERETILARLRRRDLGLSKQKHAPL